VMFPSKQTRKDEKTTLPVGFVPSSHPDEQRQLWKSDL
jgi:hypothetical protein